MEALRGATEYIVAVLRLASITTLHLRHKEICNTAGSQSWVVYSKRTKRQMERARREPIKALNVFDTLML